MAPEFPTRIARVGAVLTLLGSLIWVQWPIDLAKFNAAALILLIGSFMAWVSIELADSGNSDFNDNIMSEDVDKLNSLLKMIDKNQFYILKEKAIQTYMDDDDYDGLANVISYCRSDIFPFHSQKIQALYDRFCTEARIFYSDFYNLYTSNGRGSSTWRPPGDPYVSDEIYRKVMSKIAVLDDKASKLAQLWEELINVSRQELKGASKAIERYEM
ncbi:hypothetical protein GOA58_07015 [Sinorhizobium meliloti]|uniref:hypothetical protein n=1 Tax=Sinorhizobium TaxID=28105 RepID=UPI000FDB5F98|nr:MULTISPECIES: hypothetical protein [Sinorhizobium]MDW9447440.1 hypothetical protein [Sinorhizobium meliloti]MDX0049898.1 hypothetical protein [Sinorhizobium meliloti]MQV98344.1 hypothetical protein [Sinorhizobium medicae]RVH11496.1 hypothetical protein CN216_25875 [Sinorhizobium meliloti]